MKSRYKIMLLLVVSFLIPNVVEAKAVQGKICCGTDGLYTVRYDDSVNSGVSLNSITCDNIREGHLAYPNGVEDTKYKFNVAKVASQCINNNGNPVSCPKDINALTKIKNTYIKSDAELTDNIKIDFNGSGKFNIKIKDVYKGKYRVRYTLGENNRNVDLNNASGYGDFMTSSGGYFYLSNINPNQSIGLEFYLGNSGDGCDGAFIGGLAFFTPDLTTVKIPNPALTDSTYGCAAFKKWVPDNFTSKNYDQTNFNNLKKDVVSKCYDKEISYSELATLHNVVMSDINSFKSLFSGVQVLKAGGGNSCTNSHHLDSKVTSWSGGYWAYTCVENYEASGDPPKLVKAGEGFSYESTFRVTKNCVRTKINVTKHYSVSKVDKYCPVPVYCERCSCDCTWVGASGKTHYEPDNPGGGPPGAGPNDAFDSCVKKCDGGKYTQECINSCYKDTYKKDRKLSFNNISIDNKNKKVQFVADYSAQDAAAGGLVTTARGQTSHNLDGTVYTMKVSSGQTCTCIESDWCQDGHGSCTFHTWLEPCGTDWEYCGRVETRVTQEEEFVTEAIEEPVNIDTSKFSMTVIDSYLNNGTYSTTYTTATQPKLNVNVVKNDSNEAIVKVSLPLSYINKLTGMATYKSDESSSTGYRMNSGRAQLEAIAFGNNQNELANYYFTPGERKYYTNINSKNLNVGFDGNGQANLRQDKINIIVSSGQNGDGAMGWAGFGSNIDCYYGVYNKFYDDKNTPCDPTREICDGGIQYIFRPIELGNDKTSGDVFPNGRNPRYNWSSAATNKGNELYKTTVNPVAYTKNIENKRDSIYKESSGEIDYEFILTPKNIAAIKNYNKTVSDFNKDGDKNYLDYDMSCYRKNNKEICTSKFLDNTDILTYGNNYSVDTRKSIAGCNNAKSNGTACDTSAHQ